MKPHRYMNTSSKQSGIRIIVALALTSTVLWTLMFKDLPIAHAAAFTARNLVVVRVGDGTAALANTATPVFLDEFTQTGAAAQTIPLSAANPAPAPSATSPNTVNLNLTLGGTSTSEGALSRSVDGRYLTLAGYNAAPGAANPSAASSATVPRVVGRIDSGGAIDTTTAITDGYSGGSIRSATTVDGTTFYTGGTGASTTTNPGGTRFVTLGSTGASTLISTSPTNTRVVRIFNNQLYTTSGAAGFVGVNRVGTGLPTTSGQTTTNVPTTSAAPSPYAFVFITPTLLYVADDSATSAGGAGGLVKFTSVDGGATFNKVYNAPVITGTSTNNGIRGLTGYQNGNNVVLYATTNEASANRLVLITDTVDSTTAPPAAAFTLLATAPTNTAFRGVAFAPTATPTAATGTISGLVTGKDGAPLSGVTMTLTGSNDTVRAITDASGRYSFADMETEGFYALTPSRADYTFSPENRAFSLLGGKVEAFFAATPNQTATANPLDTPEFFVRQQYLDFLNREPDAGGLNYWSAQIGNCKNDAACLRRKRIDVAAAFFIEQEFQQTGSYVYRVFKTSTGRAPTFAEYMQGRNRIIGGGGLQSAQMQFAEASVNAAYANLTDAQYVDQLYLNAGIAASARTERDALLANLASGAETRAGALKKIADNALFQQQDYAKAFVLAEYFSYLKRDTDTGGYAFWLDVLNNKVPGNYRSMVCAFVTSTEYQKRFSFVVTHSDTECGQ